MRCRRDIATSLITNDKCSQKIIVGAQIPLDHQIDYLSSSERSLFFYHLQIHLHVHLEALKMFELGNMPIRE